MNWFKNLSTRMKLFLGFGMVITLLLAVIVTAKRGISALEKSQKDIVTMEYANTSDLLALKASENEIRLALLMMMSDSDRAGKELWHQRVKENAEEISKSIQRLLERNKDVPKILSKLEELNKVRLAFKETRDTQIIPLIFDGKIAEAKSLGLGIQTERYEKIRSITLEMVKDADQEVKYHVTMSEEKAKQTLSFFVVVGLISILAGVFIVIFMNSIIAAPLKEISDIAVRIESGDLTVAPSSGDRKDEIGVLAHMFSKMVEGLRKQTADVMEAVNVLASSSNQIATTAAQLAAGAQETAVAVTQTTTTVEEVKQTANVSTQKARHVSDVAQNAVEVSRSGEKLVNETIAGINQIQEQMEYIAETIVRLSEHSQAIGEIIAAVDDLAEQSNLLAVNASIEASKAGEYGKGFIVVAQEIKGLAEQSKQATKQVRSILNDVQKASSAAVMATEKGSKAVDATVKQSVGTGDSIRELSRSIAEVSQAVMQIAASNQQELVGMDQVAMAMVNIKQATAQNAAGTKQVEVTVRNLHNLGQKLKTLVERYKV